MCTIAGVVFYESMYPEGLRWAKFWNAFKKMLVSGMDRGRDGTGIVLVNPDGTTVRVRSKLSADQFVLSDDFGLFLDSADYIKRGSILLVNERYQPLPQPDSLDSNERQPIIAAKCASTHNGTFSEDHLVYEDLKSWNYPVDEEKVTNIDSEVFLHLYRHRRNCVPSESSDDTLRWTNARIAGGRAYAMVDLENPAYLYLLKDFKPLTIAYHQEFRTFIFNSEEKNILEGFNKGEPSGIYESPLRTEWVPPYTGICVDATEFQYQSISIDNPKRIPKRHFSFPIENKILGHLPKKDTKKAAVICSGGLDSTTVAAILRKIHEMDVTLLHFDYGQVACAREWEAVSKVSDILGCDKSQIDIKWIGDWIKTPLTSEEVHLPQGFYSMESTTVWVPARNLAMVSIAAAWAEARGVAYLASGWNLEESGVYPDNTIEFFKNLNLSLSYGTLTKVQLVTVLERFMKPEIVRIGTSLGDHLEYSYSCDTGGKPVECNGITKLLPCGVCGCCTARRLSYAKAGLEDPQEYFSEEFEKPDWFLSGEFEINQTPMEELIEKASRLYW